jgi:hypothetical protein
MSAWLAANRGDKQELCRELDSGADMEFRDPMGRTALMEAAKHGHVDCVHELLWILQPEVPWVGQHQTFVAVMSHSMGRSTDCLVKLS